MVKGEAKSFKQESSKSRRAITLDIFPKAHYGLWKSAII